MKVKVSVCLICLVLLFNFLSVKTVFAASFQLSGTVTDKSESAIAGATVDIFTSGTTTDVVPPTTTDGSGNYNV